MQKLLLLGAVLSWLASPAPAAQEKVEICHIPPDTPDNVQTIRVGPKAADQHILKHGDFEVDLECSEGIGECEVFGETVCVAGEDICTASALFPSPEDPETSCADGLDNDCDGEVDEACPGGQDCSLDTGQCQPVAKRVFITSSRFQGDLGGLVGADGICQSSADAAGLAGIFKAWLSDTSSGPADRFARSPLPYVRLDGFELAQDWADLTDGALAGHINVDENGDSLDFYFVWTNTTTVGAPQNRTGDPAQDSCHDWMGGQVFGDTGLFVNPIGFGDDWTQSSGFFECGAPCCRLYCFEQ